MGHLVTDNLTDNTKRQITINTGPSAPANVVVPPSARIRICEVVLLLEKLGNVLSAHWTRYWTRKECHQSKLSAANKRYKASTAACDCGCSPALCVIRGVFNPPGGSQHPDLGTEAQHLPRAGPDPSQIPGQISGKIPAGTHHIWGGGAWPAHISCC